MADEPVNAVLSGEEEDESNIPGSQDDDNTGDFSDMGVGQTAPAPSTAPVSAPTPNSAPSPVQVDSSQKVHPHMAILAGMLNRILGGIQNAPGNPNNAFDRGFMQASPNQKAMTQAAISKAQSAADLEKMQVSITGLKALQLEYLIKRLPQAEQEAHLKAVSDFKKQIVKDGGNIEAEGTDEKASDAQAVHLNATDQRATSHAGRFYSLPTMDSKGNAQFDVVFVPNKNVLQDDFTWTDSAGKDHTIEKGTPFAGGFGKLIDEMQKDAQGQTKEEHKKMADALGPVEDTKAEGTADYLQRLQKEGNPLYQQNKAAVDAAIPSLRAQAARAQAGKEKVAAAGAARIEERQLTGKQAVVDTDEGPLMMSAKEAAASGNDDFTTLSGTQAMQIRDKRANADASMNALTNYEKTFAESKLSPAEKDAMRQIVLQVQHDVTNNKGGILGDILNDIPLVGPVNQQLNGYVNRLITGGIQSGSWDALSPKAKTMMTQYFMSVVANFANMKQMLGSVGRNPAMIQAETNTIPLPYLDRQSAQSAFNTKLSDLKQRNLAIPRIKGARNGSEINREKLWEEEGNRRNVQ